VRRPSSNLLSFLVAAIAVVVSLSVAALTGRAGPADVLRHLPKEADMVVATGDVRSLWRVLAEHFAAVAQRLEETKDETTADARTCELARASVDGLMGCLAAIRHGGFDALVQNGVDVERGLVVSLVGVTHAEPGYLVRVGVRDRERFARWLAALGKLTAARDSPSLPPGAGEVELAEYCGDSACTDAIYLAFPLADVALVTNSRMVLDRALANSATNHAHGRDDEGLGETLHAVARRGEGRIAVLLRAPADASPLRRLTARMHGDRVAFNVDGELDVEAQQSRLLDAAVKRPSTPAPWVTALERDTPAAVTLLDDSAKLFVASTARLMESTDGGWPFVLRRLGEVRGLRAVTFAVTGRRGSLPDFLLGAWAGRAELKLLTTRLQADLYATRDRAVLTAAFADARAQAAKAADVPELIRLQVLAPERRLTTAVVRDGKLTPGALIADEERFVHGGRLITYLAPRLTRNDLELRKEFARFRDKPIEQGVLTSDRGRLAAMAAGDGMVWIATDVEALKTLATAGERGADTLVSGTFFPTATASWSPRDKAEVFVDIVRLVARGMLTPDSGVADAIREPLDALRDHPALGLNVSAVDGRSRMRFSVRLLRTASFP
jgi:hypothetical protein